MTTVNIQEAKSSFSRLVRSIEEGLETEVIIARNGRPAARLVALASSPVCQRLGVAKGRFVVPDSIDQGNAVIAGLFNVA